MIIFHIDINEKELSKITKKLKRKKDKITK